MKAMMNNCNIAASTGESFVTCCEEDWQIYVASFARNLCQEFNTDNTSIPSSIPHSHPPTEIVVMGKKAKKQPSKKRTERDEEGEQVQQQRRKDGQEKRRKKEVVSTRKNSRRNEDTEESSDEERYESDDDGDDESRSSEEDDEEKDEEDEDEDKEEDNNNGKVTPEGAGRQRNDDLEEDDDANPFEHMTKLEQLHWLQDVMVVSPESNFPNDFHKNRIAFEKGMRSIIRRNEQLEMEVRQYKANWEVLKASKKTKKVANLTVAQQQILLEAKGAVINKVCRMIKFPKTGWELYSNNPNSVFDSMIRTQVSFPTGMTGPQMEILWNNVIAPSLPRALTNAKNRILQDIKKRFLGM